jgi:hypothetical protein
LVVVVFSSVPAMTEPTLNLWNVVLMISAADVASPSTKGGVLAAAACEEAACEEAKEAVAAVFSSANVVAPPLAAVVVTASPPEVVTDIVLRPYKSVVPLVVAAPPAVDAVPEACLSVWERLNIFLHGGR